jgi:zinc finger FYVE domain-containing protein 26
MRYALESSVLALGAMEKIMSDETETRQNVPLVHLKDLRSHLDAISNLPRKVISFSMIL